MIDILELTNKFGRKLCKVDIHKNEKTLNFQANLSINIPKVKIYFKQNLKVLQCNKKDAGTQISNLLTVDIDKCYDEWNFDLINVSHGPNSVLNSFNTATITKQDLNLLLRMIFAFDFTKKNIQKKFFEEKTTAEIQKLTYKDVENLKKKESEILKVFYNRIHDILQHRNIQDAQFYLDEVFGKDYINLDDYILSYLQNEHRLQSYFESKNKINTEKQKNKLLKESFPDIFDEK